MVDFANYMTIQDSEIGLPRWDEVGDHYIYLKHYPAFNLPNLDRGRTAVLWWKMRNHHQLRLDIWLNKYLIVQTDHRTGEGFESYHEIITGTALKEENNEFVIGVAGFGGMGLSDIVLTYGARIDLSPEVVLPLGPERRAS